MQLSFGEDILICNLSQVDGAGGEPVPYHSQYPFQRKAWLSTWQKNDLKLPVYSGLSNETKAAYKLSGTPQTIVISPRAKSWRTGQEPTSGIRNL
jgi:hypothetical protein